MRVEVPTAVHLRLGPAIFWMSTFPQDSEMNRGNSWRRTPRSEPVTQLAHKITAREVAVALVSEVLWFGVKGIYYPSQTPLPQHGPVMFAPISSHLVSGFGFRFSGFWFLVSGFRFRFSGFGFRLRI